MSKTIWLKLLLVLEALVLVTSAAWISRDYQDEWVLQDLEVPFVVFVATYLLFMAVENEVRGLLSFSLVARIVFLLIPVLKYQWFYGTAIDQHMHYRLAEDIYVSGHIPTETTETSTRLYIDTPLMHSVFASFSLTSGVSVLDAFKFLPIFIWGLSPLIIYSMMKMLIPKKEGNSIMKYALILSSIPVAITLSYVVVGMLFGAFLVLVAMLCFTYASSKGNNNYMALVVAVSLALAAAHSYSSIILAITISITYVLSKFFKSLRVRMLNASFVTFLLVLSMSWLSQTTRLYKSMTTVIKEYLNVLSGLSLPAFGTTGVRPRLFELKWIDRFRTILPFDGGDLVIVFLTFLGVIIVFSKFRSWRHLKFLGVYLGSLWSFFFVQAAIGSFHVGVIEYNRVFEQTLPMAPILSAVALNYFGKKKYWGKPVVSIILLLSILLCTLQFYNCQPVLPTANAVSAELPSDEPIVYLNTVNSIYQRSMVFHLNRYTPDGTLIACDRVTQHQIVGLTQFNFSQSHLSYYYPFSKMIDESVKEKRYDLFLIHMPGKSGPFHEKAEIRTRNLIVSSIQNSSILYNNGESYILEPSVFFNVTTR